MSGKPERPGSFISQTSTPDVAPVTTVRRVHSHRAPHDGRPGSRGWRLAGVAGLLACMAAVSLLVAYLTGPPGPATAVGAASAHQCGPRAADARCQAAASSDPAPGPAPLPADAAAAASVLVMVNQARARAGLPPYTVTPGLRLSSARHTKVMAGGCGLSHQCPGEPPLGDRQTAAGVRWTAAGENIGEGGGVAGTTAAITRMALFLTRDMLEEKPPDDGHRLNLLSTAFKHVGITVYRDARGTVWLTQDFSN